MSQFVAAMSGLPGATGLGSGGGVLSGLGSASLRGIIGESTSFSRGLLSGPAESVEPTSVSGFPSQAARNAFMGLLINRRSFLSSDDAFSPVVVFCRPLMDAVDAERGDVGGEAEAGEDEVVKNVLAS